MKLGKLAIAGILALASSSSQAANVLGVTWDPDGVVDFSSHGVLWEELPNATPGDIVTGYGFFNQFNGSSDVVYGGGTNLLTFVFTATLASIDSVTVLPGGNSFAQFTYTPGHVDVYSTLVTTYSPDSSTAAGLATQTLANATGNAANLFLSADFNGDLTGGAVNFGTPAIANGFGNGYLDVIGGAAAAYFDTNTVDLGGGNFADLLFSSSFSAARGSTPAGYPVGGTIDVFGDTRNVPEPSMLALMGIGMLGLGFSRSKQRQSLSA